MHLMLAMFTNTVPSTFTYMCMDTLRGERKVTPHNELKNFNVQERSNMKYCLSKVFKDSIYA